MVVKDSSQKSSKETHDLSRDVTPEDGDSAPASSSPSTSTTADFSSATTSATADFPSSSPTPSSPSPPSPSPSPDLPSATTPSTPSRTPKAKGSGRPRRQLDSLRQRKKRGRQGSRRYKRWMNDVMLGRDPDDVCDAGVRVEGVAARRGEGREEGREAEVEAAAIMREEQRRVKDTVFTQVGVTAERTEAQMVWQQLLEVTEEQQEVLLASIGIEGGVGCGPGRLPSNHRQAAISASVHHVSNPSARKQLLNNVDQPAVEFMQHLCHWIVRWLARTPTAPAPAPPAAASFAPAASGGEALEGAGAGAEGGAACGGERPRSELCDMEVYEREVLVTFHSAFHRFLFHNVCEYYGLRTRSFVVDGANGGGGAGVEKTVEVRLGSPVSITTDPRALLPSTSLRVYLEEAARGPAVKRAGRVVAGRTKTKGRAGGRRNQGHGVHVAPHSSAYSTYVRAILGM